jgi:hypothetical protein
VSRKNRVRELADMVVAVTGGGAAIVDFLDKVRDGRVAGASVRDRIEAAKILLERGYGKAPLQLEVKGKIKHTLTRRVDVSRLTDEELESLRRTLRRAAVDVAELPPPPSEEPPLDDAEVVPDDE